MHGASCKRQQSICALRTLWHTLSWYVPNVCLAGRLSAKRDSIIMEVHMSNPPTSCPRSQLENPVLHLVACDMIISETHETERDWTTWAEGFRFKSPTVGQKLYSSLRSESFLPLQKKNEKKGELQWKRVFMLSCQSASYYLQDVLRGAVRHTVGSWGCTTRRFTGMRASQLGCQGWSSSVCSSGRPSPGRNLS